MDLVKLRTLKSAIRKDEQGLARSLAEYIASPTAAGAEDAPELLRSYLGYLAHWRLRLDPAWPRDRYVDAVDDLTLKAEERDRVHIRGVLWWGLGSNQSGAHTSEPFEGTVRLSKSGRQLAGYRFIIGCEGSQFVVKAPI